MHRVCLSFVVLAAVWAAGCGGSSNNADGGGGTTAKPPQSLTDSTPAAGGQVDKITWALPNGEPTTLDPIKVGDYSPSTVITNICEPLMRLHADYSITPGLAKSVKNVGDKRIVYTFNDGVKFSDGKAMTADDVVASLKRNMDEKLEPINGAFFTNVKSIKATGPLEVTVDFTKPDELFTKAMSTEMGDISETSAIEAAGKDYGTPAHPPVCTGPYKVASWKAGAGITLEANPYYWDAEFKPKVKTVDFKFITDSSTLTSALLSGSIDGTYEAPASSMTALRTTDAGHLYLGPSTQVIELGPANPDTPMANPDLTNALDRVIDRPALARNVYKGAATANRAVVPPSAFGQGAARAVYQQGYDALRDNTKPDVEAAKQLVAKAGAPSKTMVMALPAGDTSELQIATFVQAAAKSIGLNFKLKQMPATEFSSLFYDESKRKDVDLVVTAGYLEIPDPLSYAAIIIPKGAFFNWTGAYHEEVDQLLAKSQTQLEPTASAQSFVDAQAIYEKDRPLIPVVVPYERLFMNKRITGAPASFAYINMPWAAMIGAAGA
jgi:peptide/nickel transport system substrate-binding protein